VVALKGARTIIAAPGGERWQHEGGNIGLATSGSGDVLAGIIAGLAARGAELAQAVSWGVALHARAGERLAERSAHSAIWRGNCLTKFPPSWNRLAAAMPTRPYGHPVIQPVD
jgi:NAD(P)H-hydrate repair Nnr-like enzyme with NAD(P)H-hydrate dehydratase domain